MPPNSETVLKTIDCGVMAYDKAWKIQSTLLEARATGQIQEDILLLLEHPHVFTIGRRGGKEHLIDPTQANGIQIPSFDVNRGGDITYHGPGQLVGYPVLKLDGVGGDVIRYLRTLEQILIQACGSLGVSAQTRPPYTGVWVGEKKLASIGIAVRKGVTQHGFALNVCTELTMFDKIVPCGLHGVEMASIASLTERPASVREAKIAVGQAAGQILNRRLEQGRLADLSSL